ncbi:hypothetical protein LY76DRAFT_161756 [Colletotrichum caudatum]|nr:hypothetical protein LY76DRAFT_161756 [Colletotrichum caudatum]
MDDATPGLPDSRAKRLRQARKRKRRGEWGGRERGGRGHAEIQIMENGTCIQHASFETNGHQTPRVACPVSPCLMALMDLLDKRPSLAGTETSEIGGRQGKFGGNNPQPSTPFRREPVPTLTEEVRLPHGGVQFVSSSGGRAGKNVVYLCLYIHPQTKYATSLRWQA